MKLFVVSLLTILISLAAGDNGVDERVCPCGFVNELNCTTLSDGVKTPLTELCALNGTKDDSSWDGNRDVCDVDEDKKSFCICKCGWFGDTCSERVEIDQSAAIVSIVLPVVFLIIFVGYIVVHNWKYGGNEDWKIDGDRCSIPMQPYLTPKHLLVYRSIMLIIGLYWSIEVSLWIPPFAFTIWNWLILTLYFAIGTYLSIKQVKYGPTNRQTMTPLERVHYVLLETELPATILIAVVIWFVLYPISGFNEGFFDPFQVFSHFLNIFFMVGDLWMNGLYIKLRHFVYTAILGCLYVIFHASLMIINEQNDKDHCPLYFFLTLSEGAVFSAAWTVGLLITLFIFYLMGWGISRQKERKLGHVFDNEEYKKELGEVEAAKTAI